MPWERPGDKFGTSQGHPRRLGRFMWKFTFKGQNVRGTDGTCPRDRWDMSTGHMGHKPGGVPPKFFLFIGFFLSRVEGSNRTVYALFAVSTEKGNAHLVSVLWNSSFPFFPFPPLLPPWPKVLVSPACKSSFDGHGGLLWPGVICSLVLVW